MSKPPMIRGLTEAIVLGWLSVIASSVRSEEGKQLRVIPKAWVEEELASQELPNAHPGAPKTKHVSPEYYYQLPVRPIYKSYPVYAPDKGPARYMEWLKEQEPVVIWGEVGGKPITPKLDTEEDWIKAGELVFGAPMGTNVDPSTGKLSPFSQIISVETSLDPEWYETVKVPVTEDGIMPYLVYVIRAKGQIEMGNISCGTCHTRVMNKVVVKGAQGNFPFDRTLAYGVRSALRQGAPAKAVEELSKLIEKILFEAPWIKPGPLAGTEKSTLEDDLRRGEAIPGGVLARHGASVTYPVVVPDLIGIKDRKYFDRTGLMQHRGIADLMRYGSLNHMVDLLNQYGDYIPLGEEFKRLPDPKNPPAFIGWGRLSDEQLYALALYLYSLTPPENPNKLDAVAARGKEVFEREDCGSCHEPPLYTNNRLTPVRGFKVPPGHRNKYKIHGECVETDPNLALQTRRGTGYYKVPTLKGAWYRGPFGHSGSVATLEDWFDAERLRDTYVPTGFKPAGVERHAVPGHEFGLDLSPEDNKALIAFLKTL